MRRLVRVVGTLGVLWFMFGWFCPRLFHQNTFQTFVPQVEGRLVVIKSYCERGVFYAVATGFDRVAEMYKIDPQCLPSCTDSAVEVYLSRGDQCMWLELTSGSTYFPYRDGIRNNLREKLANTPLRF
ncbi:MAG TPA: hypothetical protein VJH75_03875 [Patescibacteria group bacterium]|nr:hypothetical protein [Patescibacteria group bacterium]